MSGCGDPIDNQDNKKYNVVLITVDTLRADRLGVYGYDRIETPNMDRLAEKGICFKKAFSPCPITLPSHVSIMTGTSPLFHGVRNNGIYRARDTLTTMAEVLKGEGYATGAVIAAYVMDSAFGLDQGFDMYDDDIVQIQGAENPFFYPERKAEEVTQRSYAFIKRHADRPFFLWVHYFDPHAMYQPPPRFAQKYPDSPYDGEVAYTDSQIGSLMKMLRVAGVQENTLVVLTSDHGESLKEHGEDSHGMLLYDTTLHVPLILFNEELIPGSQEIESLVSLMDIMPTVFDILNIDPGDASSEIQGKSLVPLIKGEVKGTHDQLYFETLLPYFDFGWAGLRGIRNDEIKYISGPVPELFNTDEDPKEASNLYEAHQDRAEGLHTSLMNIVSRFSSIDTGEGRKEMDEEVQKKLSALGYSSGALHSVIEGDPFQGLDPKERIWVEAKLNHSAALFSMEKYTEALESMQELLNEEPDNPNVVYFLAYMNAQMGRLDEAIAYYKRLYEIQPTSQKVWNNLGVLYNQQGRNKEARECFEKALEQDPYNANACYNVASVYSEDGDQERAEEYLKRAVELMPSFSKAYNNLGTLYAQAGKYKEAAEAYKKATSIEPNLGLAHKNCARCFMLLNDARQAQWHLDMAIRLGIQVDPNLVHKIKTMEK
jgi:arylsulfatase A-like enzyme/Tfp pilus assembly protein PilF